MGQVAEVFRWHFIGPNVKTGVFIHPYGQDEFVAFSLNVRQASNQPSGAYEVIGVQQEDGPTTIHTDGLARTIWVENITRGPQPYVSVGLMRFRQRAGE